MHNPVVNERHILIGIIIIIIIILKHGHIRFGGRRNIKMCHELRALLKIGIKWVQCRSRVYEYDDTAWTLD